MPTGVSSNGPVGVRISPVKASSLFVLLISRTSIGTQLKRVCLINRLSLSRRIRVKTKILLFVAGTIAARVRSLHLTTSVDASLSRWKCWCAGRTLVERPIACGWFSVQVRGTPARIRLALVVATHLRRLLTRQRIRRRLSRRPRRVTSQIEGHAQQVLCTPV